MNYYLSVLKNYATFTGRARRSEFWWFVLINIIVSAIVGFISGLINFPSLIMIYNLAVFIPTIAVTIRRMHDVGKSGWFCLIPIYSLILALTEGNKGENEYGQDPK